MRNAVLKFFNKNIQFMEIEGKSNSVKLKAAL